MANIWVPNNEERKAWAAWVAGRPDAVRRVAERFFPWILYRIKSGHRVVLHAFDEPKGDGPVTVTVAVLAQFNGVVRERNVFGISPDELVECDLPAPNETGLLGGDAVAIVWNGVATCRPGQVGGLLIGCMIDDDTKGRG
jgi:hypothetical protein